jgi:lipid-A-disaccharide synthase
MGLTKIITNIFYLFKIRKDVNDVIEKNNFTHVFFIDSFDFTKFYLDKYPNKLIKFNQIIGPSVFIWKKHKAKYINQNLDHLFSIFRIEESFYLNNKYSYIGHPLKNKVFKRDKLFGNIQNIGFFLGSRDQEVYSHLPTIKKLILKFINNKKIRLHLFTTKDYIENLKDEFINLKCLQIHLNDTSYYKNISKLDFAFACSGTVHLELCFTKVPHFIFYKANYFNYLIFKKFIKTNYLSLVNIFNDKEIIKEFIQNDFNSEFLYNNFQFLYNDKNKFINYAKKIYFYVDNSNFDNLNNNPIIDYLKKSS